MKTLLYAVQLTIAAIGGFMSWFLGGFDGYVYILAIFIVADYTTGIMKSIAERRVSSQIGAKGILKKCLMFILIGLSNLIDQYLLLDLGVLRTIVVFFYISNEGISILENANALGLPIPFKLKNLLQQIKDKAIHDKEAGKTGDAPESNSKHHVNRKPNATCKNDSASDTQSNQQ